MGIFQVFGHLLKGLCSSSIANLKDFACPLLIAPKGWPAGAIEFDERQLDLSTHDL